MQVEIECRYYFMQVEGTSAVQSLQIFAVQLTAFNQVESGYQRINFCQNPCCSENNIT